MERKKWNIRQGHNKLVLTECVFKSFLSFSSRAVLRMQMEQVGLDSRLYWNYRIAHVSWNSRVLNYIETTKVVTEDVREKLLVKTIVL